MSLDTAVYFTPWLLVFVYMALWLQARSHARRYRQWVEDWRTLEADARQGQRTALDQVDRLLATCDQLYAVIATYKSMLGYHADQSVSEASGSAQSEAPKSSPSND